MYLCFRGQAATTSTARDDGPKAVYQFIGLILGNGNYRDSRDYIGIIGYILGSYWDNGK